MGCRFAPPDRRLLASALAIGVGAAAAWAQAASLTAVVDKTTVDLGQPVTLTLVVSGDLKAVTGLPKVELPEPFQVVARSRSSNVAIRGRLMEQTVSFHYVLVCREPGTFTLGPFELQQTKGDPLTTEPLELTVKKPIVPPGSQPSERFFL